MISAFELHAARGFDGVDLRPSLRCRFEGGHLQSWAFAQEGEGSHAARVPVLHWPGTVSPGLCDLQINGGGGLMFNSQPTAEALVRQGAMWRMLGTHHWLPTFITDAPDRMAQAVQAVIACRGQYGVAGIHLEGPHISIAKRGAHQEASIRPLADADWALLTRLREQGVPTLVTLAPECQPEGTIARLVAMGVVVSIGHTAGNHADGQRALAEGAVLFTHLFNGMTGMGAREPGMVGAALDSNAWCGVIADGHHVSDPMLRIAFRARPQPDRMVLVSDAMATVGGPDRFELYGETIAVHEGRLINEQGSLAGAHITLAEAVTRLIQTTGIDPQTALRAATHNPVAAMGLPAAMARLRVGMAWSDLLFWGEDYRLRAAPAPGAH